MKKIISMMLILAATTVGANDGLGHETQQTKELIKKELERNLLMPACNKAVAYDEAYIEVCVKPDGSLIVTKINAASDEIISSIEQQISRIHLAQDVYQEGTYVFRVCFRSA
jgi:hypothetical protein